MTIKETASNWRVTPRRVQILCSEGRVVGAFKHGSVWFIPKDTVRPAHKKRGPKEN